MKTKSIVFIVLAVVLTFSHSLSNEFVGDDKVLFLGNDFYTSLDHVKSLFSSEYLTPSQPVEREGQTVYHSGSVAYRPVLSLTFFLDYALWELNPLGHHLTNLIIHILNTIFVYFLILLIIKKEKIASWTSLLFGLHPIKVEAVCSIGYRANLLFTFFALLSFICFVRYLNGSKTKLNYLLSTISYFLALFCKESAIMLPILIFVYDYWVYRAAEKTTLKGLCKRYAAFDIITLFYLYIYFFVFPNTSLSNAGWLGGNILSHIFTMLWIGVQYFKDMLWPFAVNVIPPLYSPSLEPYMLIKAVVGVGVVIGYTFLMIKTYYKNRIISYFLLFFPLALLPAIIVPNVNPMAHRYLYFPSLGVMIIFAFFLNQVCENERISKNLRMIIPVGIFFVCILRTMTLNFYWKSDSVLGLNLIQNYPNHWKNYMIVAEDYFHKGDQKSAQNFFQKAMELKKIDSSRRY